MTTVLVVLFWWYAVMQGSWPAGESCAFFCHQQDGGEESEYMQNTNSGRGGANSFRIVLKLQIVG